MGDPPAPLYSARADRYRDGTGPEQFNGDLGGMGSLDSPLYGANDPREFFW